MKFFSAALAAFTVGSAMAAPVLDAHTTTITVGSGCGCGGKPTATLPAVSLTKTVPTLSKTAPSTSTTLPVPHQPVDGTEISVVVKAVVETVVSVQAQVKADLKLIGE